MDEETFEREVELNRRAYEGGLREEIRREHAGRYVALGLGRILASAPSYDEAKAIVRRLDPVPEFFLVFRADREPAFEPYESF
jgi:hypothetical protein